MQRWRYLAMLFSAFFVFDIIVDSIVHIIPIYLIVFIYAFALLDIYFVRTVYIWLKKIDGENQIG